MRFYNIVLILLATLLLAATGVGAILIAAFPELEARLLDAHQVFRGNLWHGDALRTALALGGTGALLLALYAVWGNLRWRQIERTVVFHNPLGEVMVSLSALEDLAKVVKGDVPGLKDLKLRVIARRKGIQVTAKVALWSDANLPGVTEEVQQAVRRYLQEILGQDTEIRPRVIVSKVVFREAPGQRGELVEYRPSQRPRGRRPVV